MNWQEVVMFYKIDDPVYQGMVQWRMETLRQWREQFLPAEIKDVLEIGTGHFPFSLGLGAPLHEVNYVGIEPDAAMSERAAMHTKGKFRKAEIVTARWSKELVEAHQWRNAFDLACSFEVFEHVRPEDRFIENVHQCLRPGGYFVLETPNAQVTPLFEKVFGHEPDGGGDYGGHEHVNEQGFRQLFLGLRAAGFEILDFDCYYFPVSLWDDRALEPHRRERLYSQIHRAAGEFPFYSYVQMFLARRK